MKYIKKKSAILLLQDGTIFYGKANGKAGDPATTKVVHETMNPLQTV